MFLEQLKRGEVVLGKYSGESLRRQLGLFSLGTIAVSYLGKGLPSAARERFFRRCDIRGFECKHFRPGMYNFSLN